MVIKDLITRLQQLEKEHGSDTIIRISIYGSEGDTREVEGAFFEERECVNLIH